VIPGISGSLLSEDALEHAVPHALRGLLDELGRGSARRRMRAWHVPLRSRLGPASAPRMIFDRLAVPLVAQLGYRLVPDGACGAAGSAGSTSRTLRAVLEFRGHPAATLLVTGWGQDPATAWRDAVRLGIGHGLRWCFCLTGPLLRITDSLRTYSRQFVEFDLEVAIENERTFAVLWGLLRAGAMSGSTADRRPLLERAIAVSEDHRAAVRSSLQHGVHEALGHLARAFAEAAERRRCGVDTVNESLVVIYRILFLLFAEARGLVPQWHPIFRDGYTIEALRQPVELSTRPRGLWETLQSIARLAHHGCRIGALRVTPFNGRLFSPVESPLADSLPLDDGAVRQALLALTTRRGRGGRERISYGDLGVEQLGGVYERVLDLDPAITQSTPDRQGRLQAVTFVRSERRKTTGSFYTPRALTEYLVRRTLAPLVHGASAETILSLRILDPAMGSGAFLVAACRYLAAAYEAALAREGGFESDAIDDRERADFRRTIAQRCLYGIDLNPMAVQLGRLSLWLATLAADRPLTFLDHRLRVGNSLVGASPRDLARQPPGGRRLGRAAALPLFDDPARDEAVIDAVRTRSAIAIEPGNTLAQVRAKEQTLARLNTAHTALSRWKQVCDLWCALWFHDRRGPRTSPKFGALVDSLLGRGSLPDRLAAPILSETQAIAVQERFFHWVFEFPEIFHSADGEPSDRPGFDAVIGNPPWEMLRGDRGDASSRESARAAASMLTRFARGSGIYALQGDGHANLYQLFLERMISLVRPGGRLGVIVPSGLATDHGAALLRRTLLDRMAVDTLISVENRDGVFPIHRGLKFLLLSAANRPATAALPCRFGIRRPDDLDQLPDMGDDPAAVPFPRHLLQRATGDDLAIPDIRCPMDVEILSQVAFTSPALGDPDGWNVRFGRELNATEDRRYFQVARSGRAGLPVIEGKHVTPFAVDMAGAALHILPRVAAQLIDPARTFRRSRLAYRDVASATNRLTLIAAVIPSGAITTHTLFCLKDALEQESQQYLCGMFNSFVANYLVRLQVSTHVTTAIIERLPMPRPARDSADYVEIATLSASLARTPSNGDANARLQGLAALLYGLNQSQFRHVLETFPLVPRPERDAAMTAFCDIVTYRRKM
jgi:hypothetical protein